MASSSTLPKLAESILESKRRRCTDVVQIVDGLALDICTSGRTAALHVSTKEGRIVIRLPRVEVANKFLAGVDANGRPLSGHDGVMEKLLADAEATAPKMDEASPRAHLAHGELARICREVIWPALVANPLQNVAQLAESHGLNPGSVAGWIASNHPGGVTTLRGAHIPVARAKGDAEKAAKGLPITKPSAKTL